MTSTQHIGAAGEILVQYRLLKLGIDSARMTTDSGIDLVVYSPLRAQAVTVQVKTQAAPTPSGGKGGLSVGFYFPDDLRAEILALTLLSTDQVWLFTRDEARELAQQHNARGIRQLYWYIAPRQPRGGGPAPLHAGDVAQHLLERRTAALFGVPAPAQELVDDRELP
jgi:hypothetical protein